MNLGCHICHKKSGEEHREDLPEDWTTKKVMALNARQYLNFCGEHSKEEIKESYKAVKTHYAKLINSRGEE
ncbi:MAG: hypothetical protein ABEK04_03415 [Candidatus Nanohalobium sp.]